MMSSVTEEVEVQEPTHMLAQLEAFKAANKARLQDLKEKVERGKRELAKTEEEDQLYFSQGRIGRSGSVGEGDVAAARDPHGADEALRLRERALEERTIERQHGELERLRHLDEQERLLHMRVQEETREAETLRRETEQRADRDMKFAKQKMDGAERLRKDLDRRATELDDLSRDTTSKNRVILQREAELIARTKEVEQRERTLELKEREVEDRTAMLHKSEATEQDRVRKQDEAERKLRHAEECSKKELAERWKLLEENYHLFEAKQRDEKARMKRLSRELEERERQAERYEAELRMREKQVDSLKLSLAQREMRLDDVEHRALDRLRRELHEREANLKSHSASGGAPQPGAEMFSTPTRQATDGARASRSSPAGFFSGGFVPQSQSPTELSPDSVDEPQ
eukprot:TRINITY_DN32095_c0_g1_i1.p1 TRINITY_DN32095_c0_g1~~TRINITY_DN32095_c0_g1_i1.p1  ORF type:complete len:401 (+),score=172.84 TRINITY_DN32095_c0_g1_i1:340-1542(+)